jgi:hypothetical protein
MPRMIPRVLLGAVAVLLLAATPSSAALKRCDITRDQRKLGPTYVTSLSVAGVSCAGGKRVVRAYYRCRKANGGIKGTCHSRVLGYTCSEKRAGIRTQFSAKVTCRNGARRVTHTYTQFT